jgi:hypothetical protein
MIDGTPVNCGLAFSFVNNGWGYVEGGAGVYGNGRVTVVDQYGPGIDGGFAWTGQRVFFDILYPGFKENDLKIVNSSLRLAKELTANTKCDQALQDYGISSLAALVNGLGVSGSGANVFDGRNSRFYLPNNKESVQQYFKDNKEKVGAAVFSVGRVTATFLGSYFFNPSSMQNVAQQRAIILIHEAVHQVGGKGDSVFGGSKELSEKIIQGCFPVLKGKLGGVG